MFTKSVLKIYESYLKRLRTKRAELAMLQLTGRLEDRLTKEFASCIHANSAGALIALSNVGNRDEQKIDLAILQGDFSKVIDRKNAVILALFEAKYLRNTHKLGLGNAEDELAGTLRDLKRQLWAFRGAKHGGFPVKLLGRRKDIYGLVFASYVRRDDKPDKEKAFLGRVGRLAKKHRFTYNDLLNRPWLRCVYEQEPVVVLKRKFRVSLRAGLWRVSKDIKSLAHRAAQV